MAGLYKINLDIVDGEAQEVKDLAIKYGVQMAYKPIAFHSNLHMNWELAANGKKAIVQFVMELYGCCLEEAMYFSRRPTKAHPRSQDPLVAEASRKTHERLWAKANGLMA